MKQVPSRPEHTCSLAEKIIGRKKASSFSALSGKAFLMGGLMGDRYPD
ncbi:MAG: hypothetical protein AAFY26_18300 [Cyanobacteria bacterium J06638_22]